jgi:hypothetical protein
MYFEVITGPRPTGPASRASLVSIHSIHAAPNIQVCSTKLLTPSITVVAIFADGLPAEPQPIANALLGDPRSNDNRTDPIRVREWR